MTSVAKGILWFIVIIVLGGLAYAYLLPSSSEAPVNPPVEGSFQTGQPINGAEGVPPEPVGLMDDGVADPETSQVSAAGGYQVYSPEKLILAEGDGRVVLFFRAGWCPSCRALDADIKTNLESIPENLTILDVDYDTATELKQKYGVTYQHTLVEVDTVGTQLVKWSGSPTLADLLTRLEY